MSSFRNTFSLVFIATAFAYDLGITNIYNYETSVVINEDCFESPKYNFTGHRLSAKVHLTAIWQDPQDAQKQLLKLQVSQPKLLVTQKSEFKEQKSGLEKISASESFFLFNKNRVDKFWDNPKEHSVLRNLKRSVASLLQVKTEDGAEKVHDVSGNCDVLYKIEGKIIRRNKRSCSHPVQDTVLSQPFGVRSSSVEHSAGIDCEMKDANSGVVSQCLVNEQLKTYSNLWRKASICVQSTSAFIFESTSQSNQVFKNADLEKVIEQIKNKGELVEGMLLAVYKNKEEQTTASLNDALKSFYESLKTTNLAKLKSASAFFKLLPIFRKATKDDLLKVLENGKFERVLPQILDLVAASATPSSVEAVLTFFGKVKDYDERLERYLISLSVFPRPEAFIINEIKSFLEKGGHHEKIEATLITTLGSLLRNYAKTNKADSKVVGEILGYLEDSMKACKSESCTLTYLRGLRNAAQEKSVTLLLQQALKGGKASLEALLAIRNVQPAEISAESKRLLQKIFHQVPVNQDRSSRAIAAEILLKSYPEDDILKSILGSLSDQSDKEFSTFVVSKVLRLMEDDKELRSRITRILQEKQVGHYYSLSQNGKSSLFKRQLMSAEGLNASYGIEMELLEGGLLKRSSFDVELQTDRGISNLLSVGMFSGGLESFVGGDSTSSTDEDSYPFAGMELTLLGSSLRPYLFFTSTSELMGHAWSGTASEPTPALQGVYSLSDSNQLVVLHNGMVVQLQLRGAMSTDLSGSIQISIWSRNSQSQVKTSAALLVKGSAIVDTEFVRTRGEYLYYGHSAIDFSTDLEFAEMPFQMCLEMKHPDIVVKHDFQRSVEVNETKFSVKKTKKRKRYIPRRSYALHQNNNELCRLMKS